MTHFFITGGTGFVGSHMIDYLLSKIPDCEIYALKHWRSPTKNIEHVSEHNRVIWIEGDLLDIPSLERALRKASPDYVFHFAAQSFPETSFVTPVRTLKTNVIGTTNLFETMRALNCHARTISVSSSEVYGMPSPDEIPIKETNPIRAANPYSISKVGHDLMSQYYANAYNMDIVITRMFSHEGARRGPMFALSSFARQIALHEKRRIVPYNIYVGNLNSIRTYAHVADAVEAYWLAALHGKPGEVYNIGGDFTCTVGDALRALMARSTISTGDFSIVVDPGKIRPTDITLQIPDCTKFRNLTGWQPKKTFDDIIEDMLNYWRQNV